MTQCSMSYSHQFSKYTVPLVFTSHYYTMKFTRRKIRTRGGRYVQMKLVTTIMHPRLYPLALIIINVFVVIIEGVLLLLLRPHPLLLLSILFLL